MQKALIVEDNVDLAKLIRIHLEDASFDVDIANDGQSALDWFNSTQYQLVLLDVMLPRVNGLEVCKMIRQTDARVPVLMLTAKGEEIDRVVGLEVGADDYLVKPFGVAELTARVNALMRRANLSGSSDMSGENPVAETLHHGHISLNPASREVRVERDLVDLTLREFELLYFLMQHPAAVFSREELLKQVWGYSNGVYQHTVNSHINRLRAKIEPDPHNPVIIVTVWGVGYRLGSLA